MRKFENDLEMDFIISHKWFHLNPGKCHYIGIGDDDLQNKFE